VAEVLKENEMASTADMNSILERSDAIKEVHNARKQSLELNQHFVAQRAGDKRKEERASAQGFEAENRIEIKDDEKNNDKGGTEENKNGSKRKQSSEESDLSEGTFIDIKI
jgi:hypothetical protein